jgi:hypothetical protein
MNSARALLPSIGLATALCAQAAPEMLSRDWEARLPLTRVVVIAATPAVAATLSTAFTQRGMACAVLSAASALEPNGLQWRAEVLSATVIVAGGIHSNRAMLPLYAQYLSFADAAWPGGDGYILRTLARPFGPGTAAICLEASSAAGEAAAAARCVELLQQANPAAGFPARLEAHLDEAKLAALGQIGDGGMRYALGGKPEWATEGVMNVLKAADPETGFLPHSDYGIERWVREIHYLQDAPGVSAADQLRLDQAVLHTALAAADQWWRRRDGSLIGGRHQTMGTSAFTLAVQLLRRRGQPNPEAQTLLESWWRESEAYWRNACTTFHDDLEGWPNYCSAEPTLDWALILGFDGYLQDQLPLAIRRAYAVTDPMGFYAGTGTYEECRPGDVYKPLVWGWPLRVAATFHPGQGYDWLQANLPQQTAATWALGRAVVGHRAFPTPPEERAPDAWLGISPVALGPYRHDRLEPGGARAALAASLEKLCFRDTFRPDSQYFVLQGFEALRADNLAPFDANSIIRYTDLGHVWLHANSEKQGNLFRSAVFCTDGLNDGVRPGVCELRALYNGPRLGLAASLLPGYVACDWTRNVIWRRGAYVVLIDLLQQTRAGQFGLICSFRTPQRARLEADGMLAQEADATFRIRSADSFPLALDGGSGLEGAAVPTLLRESSRLDGQPGDIRVFRNLMVAADPAHPADLEIRPWGQQAALVRGAIRGETELALVAATVRGIPLQEGAFETDAEIVYIGTAGWARAGGSFVRLGAWRTAAAEGSITAALTTELEALWAAARPALRLAPPAPAAGGARQLWRFDGFTPLPEAVAAPVLTAEPAGSGRLGTLSDGVVTRYATVSWPAGTDVSLTVDLQQSLPLAQIDLQNGGLASYNQIPDPASYPPPRPLQAEFSDDGFREDLRTKTLTVVHDCTFEALHKGTVFAVPRWTCREINETARFVRLRFAKDAWPGGLALAEVAMRPRGPTAARIAGCLRRDLTSAGVPELLVWTDQAELAILRADGSVLLRRTMNGAITAVETAPDLALAGTRLLVTTREARLYCLQPDGSEVWKTDFLASAKQNSDLPTGYSIGTLKAPDGTPRIMVGNYNLASFVNAVGELQAFVRLPAAYQTMTLARGYDADGDGVEETVSTEVWGCLSVLDANQRLRHSDRLPPGRGVLLDYWEPPTPAQAKVLVGSETGLGLFDLKRLKYDWQHRLQLISDAVIRRDPTGQERPVVVVAKEDGWLLVYDEAGRVTRQLLLGEGLRAVTAVPTAAGRTLVVVALPGRLEAVDLEAGTTRVLATGDYLRLLPGDRPGVLWACGARATVEAWAVDTVP